MANPIHNPQGIGAFRDLVNLNNHHTNNGMGVFSSHRYGLARRPGVNIKAVTKGIRMIPVHHRSE